MNTIVILLVLNTFTLSFGFGIFDDENKGYFVDKPSCQKINSTFYQEIDKILKNLETRTKREAYDLLFNAKGGNSTRIHAPFSITINTNQDPVALIKKNPAQEIFHLKYQIQVLKFPSDKDGKVYVWIEGPRCKWTCNRKTQTCGDLFCWSQPSFCYGEMTSCFKKDDGVNFCNDLDDIKSEIDQDTFTINSIDIGELVDRGVKETISISDSGYTDHKPWYVWEWNCQRFENDFLCMKSKGIGAPSLGLLKTIAG
ncbi:hypothetical protein ACFFRR_000689 [Megaselia abdita]